MRTLRWRRGFQSGIWMGFLGGVVVASGFNFFAILALVMQASILAFLWGILYRVRDQLRVGPKNLFESIAGFCIGVTIVFELVFQTAILVAIVFAPIAAFYWMVEAWSLRKQASVPIQHLMRNLFVMVAIMAPLLFIVFLVVEPVVKGPLPIVGWAAGNSAGGLFIIFRFLSERRAGNAFAHS